MEARNHPNRAMKKYYHYASCLLFGVLLSLHLQAQNPYALSAIPEDLKANADAVLRFEEMVFEVKSEKKGVKRVKKIITLLNDKARYKAKIQLDYSEGLTKVSSLSVDTYDALGSLIKHLKKGDFKDYSSYDGFSLLSDNRVLYADLQPTRNDYPITLVLEYEIVYDGLLYYPTWAPIDSYRYSAEKALLKVITPSTLPLRYDSSHAPEPVLSTSNESNTYIWHFDHLKALQSEAYGPAFGERVPLIHLAPSKFEIEGYQGDLSTWDGLAEWQNLLFEKLGTVPEETMSEVRVLTSKASSDEEKVRRVYEYLQNKTRYVSIQLGIGGWQPFEPALVDEKGYGDCKALSYYTRALLNGVGIPAHYTLVRAGEDAAPLRKDFPSLQFNHVIVCVPNAGDTLWLECTSQTNPFGYLGTFTGDRDVLLITEDGGKIVHTPFYPKSVNRQERKATVTLDKTGHAGATVETIYSGLQYENMGLNHYLHQGKEQQKKWLYTTIDIPNFELERFDLSQEGGKIPLAKLALELKLRKFATVSGKRVFLKPNLMNRFDYVPAKNAERKTDIIRSQAYVDSDTIVYHLPEGIHTEYLPRPITIRSEFGTYEASFTMEADKLTYVRTVHMKKGRFPVEKYPELTTFFKAMVKADKTKVVFLSST